MNKTRLLIALTCTLATTATYAITDKKLNDLVHTFMKQNNVEGMSIAVINKNKTTIYNYGYANKEKHILASDDTLYPIASFTKTFTATLAASAAVDGKLDLNAPFINYFTGLKNDSNLNQITSSELLAHVSSFPFDFTPKPTSYSAMINDLNQYKPPYAPGTVYLYSNAGIGTMGYVLQDVYHENYQQILDDKILKPLNMRSTYLIVPKDKEKYLAVGHGSDDKIEAADKTPYVWFAAASLKSTIADMAKYLSAQINYVALEDANLSKALVKVHQNLYCFADKKSCEQLAWQAHVLSELNNSTGDSGFSGFDKNGAPQFSTQKIIANKSFGKSKIFIDKTCGGYGMSGYMAYIPGQKKGVVIMTNKFLGDERIKLGREILK